MIAGVAIFLSVLQDTAARLAAVAGVLAIGAVDLTAPLASVVSRPVLTRTSRIPARLTLVAETTVGIVLTLMAAMAGWAIVARIPGELPALPLVAVAIAAGGSSVIQARLGSPDLGAIISRFGPERVHGTLAMRAATPVVALLLTVSGIIALTKDWRPVLATTLLSSWFIILAVTTGAEPEV
jgi:hypothetical protein